MSGNIAEQDEKVTVKFANNLIRSRTPFLRPVTSFWEKSWIIEFISSISDEAPAEQEANDGIYTCKNPLSRPSTNYTADRPALSISAAK